jgi:aerobic-type carbon monoxide dehydrogenase small subunit (CoxS/CutS family)
MSTILNVNGQSLTVDVPDDTRLFWTLRDVLGMTGTKFGCGMALCGAWTVHLDGAPTRACVTPISATVGKKITTIEAIGTDSDISYRLECVPSSTPWTSNSRQKKREFLPTAT